MARQVNADMFIELTDLVRKRRNLVKTMEKCNPEDDIIPMLKKTKTQPVDY